MSDKNETIKFFEKIKFVNSQIPKNSKKGHVKCICGGDVYYTRDEKNNHLWWACNSCGSKFMQ